MKLVQCLFDDLRGLPGVYVECVLSLQPHKTISEGLVNNRRQGAPPSPQGQLLILIPCEVEVITKR